MKELDLLLRRYVDTGWAGATSAEKVLFEQVLELPDPVLAAYLLGHEAPPPSLAVLIDRLRSG